jgi:phosphoglycerate dehydrogenase-like enzyme
MPTPDTTARTPFRIGVTLDFAREAKGVIEPALAEVLDPVDGIEYETMPETGSVGVAEVLDRYDAVIAYNHAFPAASFRGLERLAVVALWGVGFDRVDVAACTEADVILAVTRDSVRRPVAEGILALIFSLAKNIRTLDLQCRAGRWRQDPPRLIGLEERVLGSVGLGNIAGEMFRLARALGFGRLLAYSPSTAPAQAEALSVELTDLDTVMRESDFVAINCPLTPKSRGMIGAGELGLMKPTACLVNTARGAIVDEAALVEALRQRKIAGAGLDVFATEPIPAGHPLLTMDNVILTPHLVVRTEECVRNTSLSACRNVLAVAQGVPPPYVANPAVLARPRVRARLAARTRT